MQVILHLSFVAVLVILFLLFGLIMVGACLLQVRNDKEE